MVSFVTARLLEKTPTMIGFRRMKVAMIVE
jgi:hypothetical protein